MQRQPQDIDRWLQQGRIDAGDEPHDGGVGGDEVPLPVDRQRRIGLVTLDDALDRPTGGSETGIVQLSLAVDRGEARGDQHPVLLAQGNLQLGGEPQHHVPARSRSAGLDEAQMPRRHLYIAGKFHLAEPPALPPVADLFADRAGIRFHAATIRQARTSIQLPRT